MMGRWCSATGLSAPGRGPTTRWCRRREAANHALGVTEGCMASGTSKKTELKLIGVARANLCWCGEYEDGELTGRICYGDKHSRFQR